MNAIETLIKACEDAFVPVPGEDFDPVREPEQRGEDDEDVSIPPLGITFGMIRQARAEFTRDTIPSRLVIELREVADLIRSRVLNSGRLIAPVWMARNVRHIVELIDNAADALEEADLP